MTDENEIPQEFEQDDPRDKMREEVEAMLKAEQDSDDNIEAEQETTDAVEEKAEVETEAEADTEAEAIELPELTPNDLWPEDFKEKFPSLPRDAQQFLIDTHRNMQTGLTQKFQELADTRRNVEAIEQAYQPLEQFARTNGMQTSQIAIQAAQAIQNIIQDPIPGAKAFLQSMGVDVNQLIEQEEYIDPQFKAVSQELQQLKQRYAMQEQQALQQGLQAAQAQLNAFINEANEQGHLKHPRFEELRPTMDMYYKHDVQSGQPERSLHEYYAMAERFDAARNQTAPQDPQKIQEPNANAVQKAKVASKNIKSKTNTKSPAQMSLRDELRAGLKASGY